MAHFQWVYFKKVKETLLSSYHYGLLIVSSFAYARGDALIIGFTAGNAALGLYSLAYRYLESLSLFPSAISQNLFHISAKKDGTTMPQLI
jgi:O-antigen/teichoic acid export membrane protein